ncbi:hypothetical protein H8959_016129 [Pygathrix nigripes]
MAAPAQPKKIVAPTVSQINAEFVTQVSLGESGVCVTGFAIRKIMLLEFSQYLENYLWMNYSPEVSSKAYLMSICCMVNEKFRENVPAWEIFKKKPDHFPFFFKHILKAALAETDGEFSLHEQTVLLLFLDHCFNSLEVDLIRSQVQQLISLPMWMGLQLARLELELKKTPKLRKFWNLIKKNDEKMDPEAREQYVGRASFHGISREEISFTTHPEVYLCAEVSPTFRGVKKIPLENTSTIVGLGSVFLNSLKQTVVTLASSAGVLSTVQSAAQSVLQSGWSVLLPTAEERARALSALLPCAGGLGEGTGEGTGQVLGVSGNDVNVSPGRRFMIDLLVGSLMADGGLESALHAAITAEIQDIEAKKAQKEKEIDEQEANASTFHRSRTPLDKDLISTGIYTPDTFGEGSQLHVIFINIASQTAARLKDVAHRISSCLDFEQHSRERSASLDLLLRFQRLLISKLYPGESIGQTSDISSKLLKM